MPSCIDIDESVYHFQHESFVPKYCHANLSDSIIGGASNSNNVQNTTVSAAFLLLNFDISRKSN